MTTRKRLSKSMRSEISRAIWFISLMCDGCFVSDSSACLRAVMSSIIPS
jgi:hypothetical protein